MDSVRLQGIYYFWLFAICSISFLVEIIFAHICHSLLLNVDALFKVSQAMMAVVQLLSANSLDQSTEISSFGLGRLGLIAELMNCIFLYAMSFSVMMEGVKHIVDNIRYERIVSQEYNSTRYSLTDHQHFRIYRPDIMLRITYFMIGVNLLTIIVQFVYHYIMHHRTKEMEADERHKCYIAKYVSTASRIFSWKHIILHTICLTLENFLLTSCAAIVFYSQHIIANYVDTLFALLMFVVCVLATFPIASKAMGILLQNNPETLDLQELERAIRQQVPNVADIHNLHVWQHVPLSYIASVHVVFTNSKNCDSKIAAIMNILQQRNINTSTVQPEFLDELNHSQYRSGCLMKFDNEQCSHHKLGNEENAAVNDRNSSLKSDPSFQSVIVYKMAGNI